MKVVFKFRAFALLTASLLIVILFSKCSRNNDVKNCCEGYTGKITDPSAEKLVNTCHFIGQDSILVWAARYEESRKRGSADSLPGVKGVAGFSDLPGGSTSFNSCIVKKIISDEKCIGLRVLYGMSADRKIHVMLVGINPDYTNLFIKEPEECCAGNKQALSAPPPPPGNTGLRYGGAEYGQLP